MFTNLLRTKQSNVIIFIMIKNVWLNKSYNFKFGEK